MQVIANHSYVGSNPILASTCSPGGEIGRRKGLKIPRWQHRAGSIPALGTIYYPYQELSNYVEFCVICVESNRRQLDY